MITDADSVQACLFSTMEYNTTREQLRIKEYGRGIHDMVKQLKQMSDKEQRQKNAEALIEIMALLSPQQKTIDDYKQKLWDHLFLMADYDLDVESPYPMPVREEKQRKPEPLPYPKTKIRWNHFGKKFESIFDKAMAETDEEKKQGYIQILMLFMRLSYTNWHKGQVQDDMLRDELLAMSKGQLDFQPGTRFNDVVDVREIPTISGVKQTEPKVPKRYYPQRTYSQPGNGPAPVNRNKPNKFNYFKKKK
ncbi:MAG: DUF4290 domain-containing protein [Chitinophagaceae bacterium]|nr:DUF4290 domain-containing protein [Chitinophagaceae bacterium]